ncbi:hypothetical protein J437_LFUL002178, partial [Ladona fulva]
MDQKFEFDPNTLQDLLPIYYKRLFPSGLFYKWLNYGDMKGNNFRLREFSFTLAEDIYLRHLTFNDKEEFERELLRHCPHKIDIGPILNLRAKEYRTADLKPVQKEFVLDIDLTDYDEIRTCCQGGNVCTKCWKYMVVAIKVLDAAMRDDFGFKHMLWVFSGRRGIHCWIGDVTARMLDGHVRSAIIDYLTMFPSKKPYLTDNDKYHFMIRRTYQICLPFFKKVCLEEQNIFAGAKGLERLLLLIEDSGFLQELKTLLKKTDDNSTARWELVTAAVKEKKKKGGGKRGINSLLFEEEMVIRYLAPRLDAHVSTGMGHLLKSPFCIHPKTGFLAMPFNPKVVDKFDPTSTPPTITQLLKEIDAFDARTGEILKDSETRLKVKDARKTSMHKSLVIFEEYLKGLANERKETNLMME